MANIVRRHKIPKALNLLSPALLIDLYYPPVLAKRHTHNGKHAIGVQLRSNHWIHL